MSLIVVFFYYIRAHVTKMGWEKGNKGIRNLTIRIKYITS